MDGVLDCENLRLRGAWPADVPLVVRHSVNETPPVLVCLGWSSPEEMKRDDGGVAKSPREICVHQTERQRDEEIRYSDQDKREKEEARQR